MNKILTQKTFKVRRLDAWRLAAFGQLYLSILKETEASKWKKTFSKCRKKNLKNNEILRFFFKFIVRYRYRYR